jgi:hypothetical protein
VHLRDNVVPVHKSTSAQPIAAQKQLQHPYGAKTDFVNSQTLEFYNLFCTATKDFTHEQKRV